MQSVLQALQHHSTLAVLEKGVKPERQRRVGCQAWKVPGCGEEDRAGVGGGGGEKKLKETRGEFGESWKRRERVVDVRKRRGEKRGAGHFREPWDHSVVLGVPL